MLARLVVCSHLEDCLQALLVHGVALSLAAQKCSHLDYDRVFEMKGARSIETNGRIFCVTLLSRGSIRHALCIIIRCIQDAGCAYKTYHDLELTTSLSIPLRSLIQRCSLHIICLALSQYLGYRLQASCQEVQLRNCRAELPSQAG